MKLFDIKDHFQEEFKEYIIGTRETGKHTVYLVYGEVARGASRLMSPNGHDEILLLLSGTATLKNGRQTTSLKKDSAVSMEPDERFVFTALSDCCYVIAGAHPAGHGH